ncbi:hypothetical protein Tcan_03352 [Toxocara canis]|uniref:C-type lectin domain-containing protein n=1 Tax=Toxocara canis TaxID=6265 RepID=A0A0B2W561_TOXCA|nr:hypothetical protein Tcan_03352 [Toxocara canis]
MRVSVLLCRLSSASNDTSEQLHSTENVVSHTLMHRRSVYNEEGTWIAGPFGNLYQFHTGDGSWLSARERCLALDSDLVTIHDPKQLEWIVSHYPLHHGASSDRAVQVGLAYASHNDDEDWRWVDGNAFNASFLKWRRSGIANVSESKAGCAILNLDEMRLEGVQCDVAASFDKKNRFICERTRKRHLNHVQSSFPIWREFEQIMRLFGFNKAISTESAALSMKQESNEASEAAIVTAISAPKKRDQIEKSIVPALSATTQTALDVGATEESDLLSYNSTDQTLIPRIVLSKAANDTGDLDEKNHNLQRPRFGEKVEDADEKNNKRHEERKGTNKEGKQTVYEVLNKENKQLQGTSEKINDNVHSASSERTIQTLRPLEEPFVEAVGRAIKTIEDRTTEDQKLVGLFPDDKKVNIEEQVNEQKHNDSIMNEVRFTEAVNAARRLEEDFIDAIKEEIQENEEQFCEDEPKHETSALRDEKINEFFGVLSDFLRQAGRDELRELLDSNFSLKRRENQ